MRPALIGGERHDQPPSFRQQPPGFNYHREAVQAERIHRRAVDQRWTKATRSRVALAQAACKEWPQVGRVGARYMTSTPCGWR